MTETEIILTSLLNCRRVDLYADPPRLTEEQTHAFKSIQERRQQGEPLQYILGETEFMGLRLKVCPGVFIPRPETELLVQAIIDHVGQEREQPINILELGTGSGNIVTALAKLLPNSQITTVEREESAFQVAQKNARFHDVDGRIRFVHQDLRDFLYQDREKSFDIIVSNPPYVSSAEISKLSVEVRREPRAALDGGLDGLDYLRYIIDRGRSFLKEGGRIYLEIGDRQRPELSGNFAQFPEYDEVDFITDYVRTDRIVTAVKQ